MAVSKGENDVLISEKSRMMMFVGGIDVLCERERRGNGGI